MWTASKPTPGCVRACSGPAHCSACVRAPVTTGRRRHASRRSGTSLLRPRSGSTFTTSGSPITLTPGCRLRNSKKPWGPSSSLCWPRLSSSRPWTITRGGLVYRERCPGWPHALGCADTRPPTTWFFANGAVPPPTVPLSLSFGAATSSRGPTRTLSSARMRWVVPAVQQWRSRAPDPPHRVWGGACQTKRTLFEYAQAKLEEYTVRAAGFDGVATPVP